MNYDPLPQELYDRFPVKYDRDIPSRITMKKMVEGFLQTAKFTKDRNVRCDYLDGEFLFGCWGSWARELPHDMLRDIRGFICELYRQMEKK